MMPMLALAGQLAAGSPPAAFKYTPGTIRATIVTEDGAPFGVSPQILGWCDIESQFGSGVVVLRRPCWATITAAGYRSVVADLKDGTVVVMKRLGANEGSTVSVTWMRAPAEARKEYERGEQQLARKKWAAAAARFTKAAELYPAFAPAWSELGEARAREGKAAEAERALERAIEADPKYLKPYEQMAGLLASLKLWKESAAVAERAFALKPVEFPRVYCYHAQASLALGRVEAAEKSAREALEIDAQGRAPEAEYFLAEALAARGDRASAMVQMKHYLERDKRGAYAEAAKKRLAEWR